MAPTKGNSPDCFIFVETDHGYHILGAWYGGYGGSDNWRLSTPLKRIVSEDLEFMTIETASGSTYNIAIHEDRPYRLNMTASGALSSFVRQAEEGGFKFVSVNNDNFDDVINVLRNYP